MEKGYQGATMSTKRRKISHGNGEGKETSVEVPKAKPKTEPTPKSNEPSQDVGSEEESTTMDNASREGNGKPVVKTFRDLVCDSPGSD